MKIAGIVAEYNPFHKGHEYHIRKTREQTGADYVVAVMSGDFVQRGECAIMDKYRRARSALQGGIDLVLELPVYYSLSSAELFASGAVSVFNSLGCVDCISFGAECGDLESLMQVSSALADESEGFKKELRELQSSGISFPAARQKALSLHFDRELSDLLSHPNNILAVEYLKALIKSHSQIEPVVISRKFAEHDGAQPSDGFAGAKFIREQIKQAGVAAVSDLVPGYSFEILSDCGQFLYPDDFSLLLHSILIKKAGEGYDGVWIVKDHLSDRIQSHINQFSGFSNFCDLIKTQNITRSAISRALMFLTLDIGKDDVRKCIAADYAGYINILGFRRESSELLSIIKNSCSSSMISKPAAAEKLLSFPALRAFADSVRSTSIYEAVRAEKYGYDPGYMPPLARSPVII